MNKNLLGTRRRTWKQWWMGHPGNNPGFTAEVTIRQRRKTQKCLDIKEKYMRNLENAKCDIVTPILTPRSPLYRISPERYATSPANWRGGRSKSRQASRRRRRSS